MNLKSIFQSTNGLRVVWRLLIFLFVFCVCQVALQSTLRHLAPSLMAYEMALTTGVLNPQGMLTMEIMNLLSLAVALAVMSRIEHRTLGDYGLPWTGDRGRRFAEGVVWGLLMVTGMVLLQRAEGVFHFGTVILSGREALKMGALWAAAMLGVGFFEEMAFRGYLQLTLASGMGFWRAAALSSLIFGGTHIAADSFYSWFGAVSATLFGLVFCVILWRTGSLWMAIGFHAAVDFTETFLFAPPTPKAQSVGHLLSSTLQGPAWLTGGSVGPEASVNGLILFAIVFALLWWVRFPSTASSRQT
jgi:membrane protease YdiL (CAAX protease family)